jgi:hypothetical protein
MAPGDIRKVRQYTTAKRIGEENTGEDPFTGSEQNIPLIRTQDSEFSRDLPFEGDPGFVRNDITGINDRVASSVGDDPSDRYKRWLDDFQPEHAASDRLNNLLLNPPTRERPSLGRTLVAIGKGFGKGGFDDQQTIMNEPYERKKDEWTSQTTPAYQAASIERQTNANERALRGNVIAAEIQGDRITSNERIAAQRDETTRAKNEAANEVATKRAEAYDFKMRHPDWKFDFSGPQVIAASPDGTQSVRLGPTGHMSDVDKINLQQKNEIERIHARGDEAQETKRTTPGGYAGRDPNSPPAETPQATKVRQANIAHQLANSDPIMRKMIKFTGSNDFTIEMPSAWTEAGRAGYKAKYDEAVSKIYGDGKGLGTSAPPPPGSPGKTNEAGETVGLGPSEDMVPTPRNDISAQRMRAANRQKYGAPIGPGIPDENTAPDMRSTTGPLGSKVEQIQNAELRRKAIEYLQQNKLPVAEENITHAIKTGRVK